MILPVLTIMVVELENSGPATTVVYVLHRPSDEYVKTKHLYSMHAALQLLISNVAFV